MPDFARACGTCGDDATHAVSLTRPTTATSKISTRCVTVYACDDHPVSTVTDRFDEEARDA